MLNYSHQPTAEITRLLYTPAAFDDLSTEVLSSGKTLRFTAHGKSMTPLVQDGDILLIAPAYLHKLKVGDVVLCHPACGRLVAHRIVQQKKQHDWTAFQVQGDQAQAPDGWLNPEMIDGKVVGLWRNDMWLNHCTPAAQVMNKIAAWRSRSRLDAYFLTRAAGKLITRLPIFARLLT